MNSSINYHVRVRLSIITCVFILNLFIFQFEDEGDCTPLFIAVLKENKKMIEFLLEQVNVDTYNCIYTGQLQSQTQSLRYSCWPSVTWALFLATPQTAGNAGYILEDFWEGPLQSTIVDCIA